MEFNVQNFGDLSVMKTFSLKQYIVKLYVRYTMAAEQWQDWAFLWRLMNCLLLTPCARRCHFPDIFHIYTKSSSSTATVIYCWLFHQFADFMMKLQKFEKFQTFNLKRCWNANSWEAVRHSRWLPFSTPSVAQLCLFEVDRVVENVREMCHISSMFSEVCEVFRLYIFRHWWHLWTNS